MRSELATYTVGLIGFDKAERRILRRLLGMSEHRQPTFKPFDKSGGGCPDVVLVNVERRTAVQAWNTFRRANALRARFCPIFVGRDPGNLLCPDPYVLSRPILTTRLFAVLDRAVMEVHGYRPAPADEAEGALLALTQDELDVLAGTTVVLDAADAVKAQLDDPHGIEGASDQGQEGAALVVDHSLPVRVQMRGVLSAIGSRVDFAETGVEALDFIETHTYSMIFLDLMLQDEDTYELCSRIKRHPLQQGASVVMLTSSSSSAERVMGIVAGFDNYLVKPIQRAAFDELVAELARGAAVMGKAARELALA